jgi:hypothetical protein
MGQFCFRLSRQEAGGGLPSEVDFIEAAKGKEEEKKVSTEEKANFVVLRLIRSSSFSPERDSLAFLHSPASSRRLHRPRRATRPNDSPAATARPVPTRKRSEKSNVHNAAWPPNLPIPHHRSEDGKTQQDPALPPLQVLKPSSAVCPKRPRPLPVCSFGSAGVAVDLARDGGGAVREGDAV